MNDIEEARRLLEYDWLECRGISGRWAKTLHFPNLDPFGIYLQHIHDECSIHDFTARCGRPMGAGHIPGVGARLETPRCSRCCASLGYPLGIGSPKNDPALRPLIERRLEATSGGDRFFAEAHRP